jgi:hypothetical protein
VDRAAGARGVEREAEAGHASTEDDDVVGGHGVIVHGRRWLATPGRSLYPGLRLLGSAMRQV